MPHLHQYSMLQRFRNNQDLTMEDSNSEESQAWSARKAGFNDELI